MKLLLDESVDRGLAGCFPDRYNIKTVGEMGWAGTNNGELLGMAAVANFDAVITVDKNMEYQQNLETLPIAIIVLDAPRSSLAYLEPMVPEVISILENEPGKKLIRIPISRNTSAPNTERKPF